MKIPPTMLAACLFFPLVHHGRAQTPSPGASPTAPGYVAVFKGSAADSTDLRQARTATRLSQRLVNGEAQLLRNFTALYQEVWHNGDGLTPQQVCDALGPKAGSLFVVAGVMANALYTLDPVGLGGMVSTPEGYTAEIHPDGTVTVTFTAPPAPSPSPSPAP